MKLSEAIFLGSKLHPQTRQVYFNYACGLDEKGAETGRFVVSSCALGAALIALGFENAELAELDYQLNVHWPWLRNDAQQCPAEKCKLLVSSAEGIITHLNDSHMWSREAVASWVASVEPQEAPVTLPAEGVEEEAKDVVAV